MRCISHNRRLAVSTGAAIAAGVGLVSLSPTLAQDPEAPAQASAQRAFDAAAAARFAELALACVHREYPNKIAHVLDGDGDVRPPRELTPVFYGCFDWHSAVHGHWLLARLCRTFPRAPFVPEARTTLAESFTAARVEGEVAYLSVEGRKTFERPYGLAWLLQLCAELREWDDDQAREWSRTLAPLERLAAERLKAWFPKLSHPIRTGEHSQTAFAMGLILDWSRTRVSRSDRDGDAGGDAAAAILDREMAALVAARAREYYGRDRGASLAFEPSGQDFLSPILAEADLMRRVMPPTEYAAWLGAFLPDVPLTGSAAAASDASASGSPNSPRSDRAVDDQPASGEPQRNGRGWLEPAVVTDPTDGKLAHLDGLNLARAWMLEGIASGLPDGDPRLPALREAARRHRESGLAAVTGAHYEGGHWLGSFAVYLVTQRGIE